MELIYYLFITHSVLVEGRNKNSDSRTEGFKISHLPLK